MPETATTRFDRVLAQLRLYEHPLLNFSARAKGEGVEIIINSRTSQFPSTPITSIFIPAISTTRSSSGAFSASSSMPCTITSWKCSSARRKIAPTAAKRDCECSPSKDRTGDPRTRPNSVLALHGDVSLRPRTWILLAQRRSSSAKPETSTHRATCTQSSAVCWPASSTKCGVPSARRKQSN